MNNIQSANRRNFFPNSSSSKADEAKKSAQIQKMMASRNAPARKEELDNLSQANAKVDINNKIKDFARIKRAVDAAPQIDNTDKIKNLKSQIKAGTYKVDYDALADKMLAGEF